MKKMFIPLLCLAATAAAHGSSSSSSVAPSPEGRARELCPNFEGQTVREAPYSLSHRGMYWARISLPIMGDNVIIPAASRISDDGYTCYYGAGRTMVVYATKGQPMDRSENQ